MMQRFVRQLMTALTLGLLILSMVLALEGRFQAAIYYILLSAYLEYLES
jgi:phosphatidylserine synthase